jgi:hypothetical protein
MNWEEINEWFFWSYIAVTIPTESVTLFKLIRNDKYNEFV